MDDNRWKNVLMRSFRLSPTLLEMIQTECVVKKLSFSEFVRQAATMHLRNRQFRS
jgi:hypothetical protein